MPFLVNTPFLSTCIFSLMCLFSLTRLLPFDRQLQLSTDRYTPFLFDTAFVVLTDRYNYQLTTTRLSLSTRLFLLIHLFLLTRLFSSTRLLLFRLTATITDQPVHTFSCRHTFCCFNRPLQLPTDRYTP
jgi:hypothetical protein